MTVLSLAALLTAAPAAVSGSDDRGAALYRPATFVHAVGRDYMIREYIAKDLGGEIIELTPITWKGNPAYRARFLVPDADHPDGRRERVLIFDAGSVKPIHELDPEGEPAS